MQNNPVSVVNGVYTVRSTDLDGNDIRINIEEPLSTNLTAGGMISVAAIDRV